MEMSASKQGPRDEEDIEEVVSENKLTLDTLAEVLIIQGGFCRLLWHGHFYEMGTETKTNGEGVVPHRNCLRQMQSTKAGRNVDGFLSGYPRMPATPAFPSMPSTCPISAPRWWDQALFLLFLPISPLNMKTFMMTGFHLMNSKSSSCRTVNKRICCVWVSVFTWKSSNYSKNSETFLCHQRRQQAVVV